MNKKKSLYRQAGLAVICLACVGLGPAYAGDGELRVTATMNDKIPTEMEVESALFPEQLDAQKKECDQLEKIGLRCQSSIPKSSLETSMVSFAYASTRLTAEAKEFLNIIGSALRKRSSKWSALTIEGHSDASGNADGNVRLSKARAEAVKSYLQTNFGLHNIEAVGRGSERLKDSGNPSNPLNRRVEFVPQW